MSDNTIPAYHARTPWSIFLLVLFLLASIVNIVLFVMHHDSDKLVIGMLFFASFSYEMRMTK